MSAIRLIAMISSFLSFPGHPLRRASQSVGSRPIRVGLAGAGQVSGGQEIQFRRDQRAQCDVAHWPRWLGVEHQCVVPFNSLAEPDNGTSGGRAPV